MKKYFLITFLFLITSLSFAQYELDYTGAQLDTALAVQRAKIYRQTKHGFQVPYSTIQSAITASDSGDCVYIKTGYYSLGSDSLKLKNGVDIFCYPGVTIYSTNVNKTISDGNVACVMSLNGFPTITNSNGVSKRIILSNASSSIKNFYWEYAAIISQTDTNPPTVHKELSNTLGSVTWSRLGTGSYRITLSGVFVEFKTLAWVTESLYNDFETTKLLKIFPADTNYLSLQVLLLGSDDGTDNAIDNVSIHIRVYP